MIRWRPISEIGASKAALVAVAGMQGIFLLERKSAEMTKENWLLFHELAPLPKITNYILPPDAYDVQDAETPGENGQEESK